MHAKPLSARPLCSSSSAAKDARNRAPTCGPQVIAPLAPSTMTVPALIVKWLDLHYIDTQAATSYLVTGLQTNHSCDPPKKRRASPHKLCALKPLIQQDRTSPLAIGTYGANKCAAPKPSHLLSDPSSNLKPHAYLLRRAGTQSCGSDPGRNAPDHKGFCRWPASSAVRMQVRCKTNPIIVVCSQIRADIRRQINDARVPDLVTSWARERADTPSTKAAATAAKVSVARGPSAAAYGAQQSRISGDSDAMNATVNILDLLLASRCRGYRGIHSKDALIIHRRKSKPFDTHHAACPKPRDGSAVRDAYAALLQPPGSPRFTALHYSRDWAQRRCTKCVGTVWARRQEQREPGPWLSSVQKRRPDEKGGGGVDDAGAAR